MARPQARIAVVQFAFALGVLAILARAAQLQLLQGERWAEQAQRQRTERVVLPARRGALYDRNGVPLAVSQEFYHVGVAPNELNDWRRGLQLLTRHLGVSRTALERDLRARKRWIYFHGPFTATQVQPLRKLDGVHLTGDFQRFYPSRALARPIIGGLSPDAPVGAAGLELALDSILMGEAGEAVLLKDRAGRRYDSPARLIRDPVPGHDVVLTLDAELQEIAERGLDEALGRMRAEGGDVVFLDPTNGDLLALASRQRGSSGAGSVRASVFTDPFEPGSTAKLFTAAALLVHGRVAATDAVFAEGGQWRMPITSSGRTRVITDVHKTTGNLTLARTIQVSSNVAMAKFSSRLSPEEQFEMLRDFGFGTPTGAEFPSESRGRLARPDKWQPMYTRASMAMGYEFGVTPVQLAAAYGAIANDGLLVTPTLVREVRAPSGDLLYRHTTEPVRRVVPSAIAAQLREFMKGAVGEGGTGGNAQLANYSLLGKTGTAVRFENGRYVSGEYTASFAALFPADNPQLVIVVKIDNPTGKYYGGLTAAPVTRTMLQQALASRRIGIDWSPLTRTGPAPAEQLRRASAPSSLSRVVLPWPYKPGRPPGARAIPVPDVAGRSAREAALALHRRGFRVTLRGHGQVSRTAPPAGGMANSGSAVTVWAE
ncbi:MAG TPA: penicillin-binding transpeptidase domain-containing protein [Gemmatimonadales bacterium]|nr:penicillin-binding transpeptidase domain-containing protein [Gemmatimonadales bacterium]